MKENVNFYKCEICGNIIEVVDGNIENIKCCGETITSKQQIQLGLNNTENYDNIQGLKVALMLRMILR